MWPLYNDRCDNCVILNNIAKYQWPDWQFVAGDTRYHNCRLVDVQSPEWYGLVTSNQCVVISAEQEQVMHHVPIILCHFPVGCGNQAAAAMNLWMRFNMSCCENNISHQTTLQVCGSNHILPVSWAWLELTRGAGYAEAYLGEYWATLPFACFFFAFYVTGCATTWWHGQ